MKTKPILTLAVAGWVCAGAAAAEAYDFYADLQYPGATRREDVDLYKVKQAGKGGPKAYERREVDWWPRKGADFVEVKQGMPLRTWTLRTQQLTSEPRRFEAHLAGLRGMGNTTSSKFGGDGGPIEPGVVLRLAGAEPALWRDLGLPGLSLVGAPAISEWGIAVRFCPLKGCVCVWSQGRSSGTFFMRQQYLTDLLSD